MSTENQRIIEIDRERLRADVNRAILAAYGEERAHVMIQALEVLGTWTGDPWAHRERIRRAMGITNPKRRIEPLSSTLWLPEKGSGVMTRGWEIYFARNLHEVEPSFITTPGRIPADTMLAIERLTLVTEGDPPLPGWSFELLRNHARILEVDLQSLAAGVSLPCALFSDHDDFTPRVRYHRQKGEERTANNRWRFGLRVDGWLAAPAYLTDW